ncbi:MAG TPA: hypothetical protein VG328_02620 [Stellaceae bacterium]|jgi:hypothetical protein|nr:hypothetical protein [Stellaceae bacterium]
MSEALDWVWSLPLIMLSVVFHVLGLGFISSYVLRILAIIKGHRNFKEMRLSLPSANR